MSSGTLDNTTKRAQGLTLVESCASRGFTLMELSMVLVIIGLIVGGILIGQNLITAAQLRGTVAQIEKYNSAVNTFRTKYGYLPGDMPPFQAATYGLIQMNNTQGAIGYGFGDGNGLIESGGVFPSSCTPGWNINEFNGEVMTFWRHLSDANLVDGQFGTTGSSLINAAQCTVTAVVGNISQSMPAAKIGRGIFITVIAGQNLNYYDLIPIVSISIPGVYTIGTEGLTPIEASNIDSKIDDGQPETGNVLAQGLSAPVQPFMSNTPAGLIGGVVPSAATVSTLNTCVISSDAAGDLATDTYNLVPKTGGNDPSCGLAIQFQ